MKKPRKLSPRKARVARPARNVMGVIRGVGQRIRLALPGSAGASLEITVDEITSQGVGLVFALSGGLEFDDDLRAESRQCPS